MKILKKRLILILLLLVVLCTFTMGFGKFTGRAWLITDYYYAYTVDPGAKLTVTLTVRPDGTNPNYEASHKGKFQMWITDRGNKTNVHGTFHDCFPWYDMIIVEGYGTIDGSGYFLEIDGQMVECPYWMQFTIWDQGEPGINGEEWEDSDNGDYIMFIATEGMSSTALFTGGYIRGGEIKIHK